jgi:TP901 family phage tail tape measure protein
VIDLVDRTVKVTYKSVYQDFVDGNRKSAQSIREVGSEGEKLTQTKQAFEQLGRAGMVVGGLLAAGVGLAIGKFAEFDQAMSNVLATGQDARDNQMALRQAAMDAGAATVFSATESANAIEEMAKAGVEAKDILGGGLAGALDLAAAGGLGVADAAGIAATALETFKLEGTDMSHVADLLAAGAGKAMGDVSDLSQALAQGGQAAALTGLSIEETTASLAAFASQGLLGSDAGTSLKTMLLSLSPTTKKAAELMDELNLRAYDQQGQFVGVAEYAGKLQAALGDMGAEQQTATLKTIFGTDAYRAAAVMLGEGEAGMRKWISAVDDSGYAAETAAQRLDNLKGDWEAFGGAVDTALISMGEGANGPLRFFVQSLTELVDGFNNLPDGAQQATLWVGAVGAAVSLGAGIFLTAVPKVAEYRTAIETMGTGAQKTSKFLGAMGKAAGFAVALFALAKAAESAAGAMGQLGEKTKSADETLSLLLKKDYDGIFSGLSNGASGVNDLSSALDKLFSSDWETAFNRWGSDTFAFTGLESSVGKAREQFDLVGDSLADLVNRGEGPRAAELFDEIAAAAEEQGYSVEQVRDLMPSYQDALKAVSSEQKIVAETTDEAAQAAQDNAIALSVMRGEAQDAVTDIEKLSEAIENFGAVEFDVRAATREFESAVDDLQTAIEKNGAGLDVTTAAGRENEAALDDLAQSALDLAGSLVYTEDGQNKASAAIQNGRDQLIQALGQFGITGQAAEEYADRLGLIPGNVPTAVTLSGTDEAISKVDRFREALSRINPVKTVTVEMIQKYGPLKPENFPGQADGGAIYGPGSGTSDTAGLFRLSNGEHVLTAAEVDAAGGHGEVERWRAAMLSGAFAPGKATGGPVIYGQARYATSSSMLSGSASGFDLSGLERAVKALASQPVVLQLDGRTVSVVDRANRRSIGGF